MGINQKTLLIQYSALNACRRTLVYGPVDTQNVKRQFRAYCDLCDENHVFSQTHVLSGGTASRTEEMIRDFNKKGAIYIKEDEKDLS